MQRDVAEAGKENTIRFEEEVAMMSNELEADLKAQ
jgi:hypothetical protein